ncbi:hypothetical protein CEXT_560611 [Caerostris extrusa]|uniref:Uncharacterized protein n=1 Tax=Caerostris extrusa TaxID=172846 RepID=A0AAV4MCU3_CAEEX|nr:hypothetical protein CEXT_560611 [Caerostris extrusa]
MAAIVKGNRGDYYRDGIIHDRLPNRQGRLLAFAFCCCNLLPQRNFRSGGGGGGLERGNRGDYYRDGIIHDRLPNRQGRLLAFAFCCCNLLPQRNFRSEGGGGEGKGPVIKFEMTPFHQKQANIFLLVCRNGIVSITQHPMFQGCSKF